MPTMTVSLTAGLAAYVEGEVASGEYGTASEVVRDALRLLRSEREAYEEKMAVLRREGQIGLDDIEAGRISARGVEDIAREALAKHRARGGA
jgi:antitoxin ParD1/3/4